ncbi:hypothetical protein [uncultured Selenomonas sp.]|uniref:hypothetical protein n=1 Tax=uncultured Selenomonas sp. TaxID=159275 RepID=UPI0028E95D14|nr:hypothetical protein [uncultured Selenomonas sp.]
MYTSVPALMRSDVGGHKENLLEIGGDHGRIYMNWGMIRESSMLAALSVGAEGATFYVGRNALFLVG